MLPEAICITQFTVPGNENAGTALLVRDPDGTYSVSRTTGSPAADFVDERVISNIKSAAMALMHFDTEVRDREADGYVTKGIKWVKRPTDVFTFTKPADTRGDVLHLIGHLGHRDIPHASMVIAWLRNDDVREIHADANSPALACLVALERRQPRESIRCMGEIVPLADLIREARVSTGDARCVYQLLEIVPAHLPVRNYALAITGQSGEGLAL